eukprot:TRINITY_DN57_c0_g1_i4.p1 TRINITY_DN57_c0_g1~~TRINITY_DN57_c0_g1_i4.p1  ORF type:complete len:111 (-),score=5.28 TRINITY_DN57_c0_g1_i4:83-415(-)
MKGIVFLAVILALASANIIGTCPRHCFKTLYCEKCHGLACGRYTCTTDCDCNKSAPTVPSLTVHQVTRKGTDGVERKFKCKLEDTCGPSECNRLGCSKDYVCRIINRCYE